MSAEDEVDEWRRLYECVRTVCLKYGKEDPAGEGDFWVVDDCWGGVGQKVVVINPQFVTKALIGELSGCIIRLGFLGAEILIALEADEDSVTKTVGGLVVHSGGFQEYWDIEALRKKYGSNFFT